MEEQLRIAFDIGGVLGKYPKQLGKLVNVLINGGVEVFVITDIPDLQVAKMILQKHDISIDNEKILCADFNQYGELCKSVLIDEHQIDILIDDYAAYCAAAKCISLFVWPDHTLPYEAKAHNATKTQRGSL